MWRDNFRNNREALLEMLQRFSEDARAMARQGGGFPHLTLTLSALYLLHPRRR